MKDKDICKEMEFNPLVYTPMLKTYKKLAQRKAFTAMPGDYQNLGFVTVVEEEDGTEDRIFDDYGDKEHDQLIRFVCLFIDRQSPFSKEKDFDARKNKCFEMLGIPDDPDNIVRFIVNNSLDVFRVMTTAYFKLINDMLYEQWYAKRNMFSQYSSYLMRPFQDEQDPEKAIKTRAGIETHLARLATELITMEASLFPDTRTLEMIGQISSNDALGGFAELFAKDPKNYNQIEEDV